MHKAGAQQTRQQNNVCWQGSGVSTWDNHLEKYIHPLNHLMVNPVQLSMPFWLGVLGQTWLQEQEKGGGEDFQTLSRFDFLAIFGPKMGGGRIFDRGGLTDTDATPPLIGPP